MPPDPGHVRANRAPGRAHVSAALALAWSRVSSGCKGSFADAVGLSAKSVNRAITEETLPELDHALASILFDPTALAEVMALYGFRLVRVDAQPGADMELVTAMARTVPEYLNRLADGQRCHVDTMELAMLFRPLIPQLQQIVNEADRLRRGE